MTAAGAFVVIADDDPDHATIVRLMLRRVSPDAVVTVITNPSSMQHGLLEAPGGALVLMDRMLAGQDATPQLAMIHARRADLRFVLLSSSKSLRRSRGGSPCCSDCSTSRSASLPRSRILSGLCDTRACSSAA